MRLLYLFGILLVYFAYLIGKADLGNEKILHVVKMIVVALLIAIVLILMVLEFLQINYLREWKDKMRQTKITEFIGKT